MDKFFFYSKSKNSKPGTGINEVVKNPIIYTELEAIKDWRKMLSNFWVEPFESEGEKWASVEHYYHSKKFTNNPEFQYLFTLDSNSLFSKDPSIAKSVGGKSGKYKNKLIRPKHIVADERIWKKVNNDNAFLIAMFCKFTQSKQLKKVLLATKESELWHIVSRKSPIRFTYLEKVRECIQKYDNQIDLIEVGKNLKFKIT